MFDLDHLKKSKSRSISGQEGSEFLQFVHEDLLSRLASIDKAHKQGVLVVLSHDSCNWFQEFHQNLITKLSGRPVVRKLLPDELSDIQERSMDFICFPFGLHWISNVQEFLRKVFLLLKSDGIFIGSFAGGGSLQVLRKTLFLAEEAAECGHSPHISPFIRFEHVITLLSGAGFAENIVDFESIALEHDCPTSLMRALKNVGESNALVNRTPYSINRKMYEILTSWKDRDFCDQVILITLVASPKKNSIKLGSMV